MEAEKVNILLIEDNPGGTRLIQEMLSEAVGIQTELEHTDTLTAGLAKLSEKSVDILLLDLSLPDGQGLDVFFQARKKAPDTPILVLTGLDDQERAIKALREGAQDYLVKGQVDTRLLSRAIRYAIERSRAEAARRESEQQYQLLFQNMASGIIYGKVTEVTDGKVTNFVILDANEIAKKLGFAKPITQDVIGKKFSELPFEGEEQTDVPKVLGNVALSGKPARFERYFEPTKKWMSISTYSPKEGHFVAILDDITERKEAESREKQLQQELNISSRLASLGEMAAGIAHEINNPLSGVVGFSEILAERDVPTDIKRDLKIIHDSAQRVAGIVKNMLDFAHPHSKGQQYTDINTIINRVLDVQAYEFKTGNIKINTKLDPKLPKTILDESQIQQVLVNIFSNSQQAMLKAHGRGKLDIVSQVKNDKIIISVTDDGEGISPENLEKIFDPFFTTKDPGEGTGLGLSISYSIIKDHKGNLYATSKKGKGSTFFIELPILCKPEQLKMAVGNTEEKDSPLQARILAVDDEPHIGQLIKRLLSKDGHEVEMADNATTALEKIKLQRYNLILLDMKMPGMNGMELFAKIGKIAPSIQKRVIFITGDTISPETKEFLKKNKAAHLNKPFAVKEFSQMVNKKLRETR